MDKCRFAGSLRGHICRDRNGEATIGTGKACWSETRLQVHEQAAAEVRAATVRDADLAITGEVAF